MSGTADTPRETDAGTAAEELGGADDRLTALYPDDAPKEPAGQAEGEASKQESDVTATEYQLTPPEGYVLTPEIMGEVAPVFREIGLSNDQANKLMPLAGNFVERILDQQHDEFSALRADWARQSKNDSEIGGAKFNETLRLANMAMDAGGAGKGSEFRKLMDQSGLGNHPAVIRVFRRIGEQLSRGGRPRPQRQSRLEALYPNDVPQSGS